MRFEGQDILEIMQELPAVTIAMYNQHYGSHGTLRIIGKDGKRVTEEYLDMHSGGGNGVDGPALEWLANGAIPTNTVRAILSYKGILLKRHLQIGVDKKAISQEEADKKYNKWIKEKEKKIQDKVDSILKLSEEEKSKRLEAEKQASKKRADDIANKEKEKIAKAEEASKEEAKAEDTAPATEEAPKEEATKEEENK